MEIFKAAALMRKTATIRELIQKGHFTKEKLELANRTVKEILEQIAINRTLLGASPDFIEIPDELSEKIDNLTH